MKESNTLKQQITENDPKPQGIQITEIPEENQNQEHNESLNDSIKKEKISKFLTNSIGENKDSLNNTLNSSQLQNNSLLQASILDSVSRTKYVLVSLLPMYLSVLVGILYPKLIGRFFCYGRVNFIRTFWDFWVVDL
jgi:hypothetical protein